MRHKSWDCRFQGGDRLDRILDPVPGMLRAHEIFHGDSVPEPMSTPSGTMPGETPVPRTACPPCGLRSAVVRASTRTTVSITSMDSANKPSIEESSSSFNCGSTSFTTKDGRPHHRPARRLSGELQWS